MRPAHTGLAVLVAALWGVNFVVIDIGLDHFPPLLFCALRFLLSALPAVFLVGRPCVPWRWVVGVGLALGVGKFGLLFLGMNAGMPAGLSSLVLQIQAVFTALIACAFLGERPGRVRIAGMAVALAGIAVAAVDEGSTGPLGAFALVLVAASFWGVSNVLTRKASPGAPFNFMVWSSTVPVLPLLGLSLVFEGPSADAEALRSLDLPGAGAILFVALVSTLFCFSAWSRLLRRYAASTVAPYSLLVPAFGMAAAALFLDESVTPLRWCAAALLVAGVAVTSVGPRRRTAPAATAVQPPAPDGAPRPADTADVTGAAGAAGADLRPTPPR
ncbi:EamA family transporter [Streptomyces sp. SID5785]|uniref:EamA family transporter n=1 Tax=Streptomyces sp. SID5785 TaxID=2690309 RepID=UPI001361959C|nr:EamA family transporter [Streptomyces sp. SID5785]MZD05138.1 EamA family transporter [Streptomyces sp. SID5785]